MFQGNCSCHSLSKTEPIYASNLKNLPDISTINTSSCWGANFFVGIAGTLMDALEAK